MKFPVMFKRYVGTIPIGMTALGADELPSGRANNSMDNVLNSRFSNINGWPVQRVAVVYMGPGDSPSTLSATMWFYEDGTNSWYQIGASQTLTSGQVSFFDCVALLDMPNTNHTLNNALSGSLSQVLIVEAGDAGEGEYMFAMGPDLTSQA
jgi:hypothetical protein